MGFTTCNDVPGEPYTTKGHPLHLQNSPQKMMCVCLWPRLVFAVHLLGSHDMNGLSVPTAVLLSE